MRVFLSKGRVTPEAECALARHIVLVCEFHAAFCVARTPLRSETLPRDSLPEKVVLILGRLVRTYGAAADAEMDCDRIAAADHFYRLAIIVAMRLYGAASDITGVSTHTHTHTHTHAMRMPTVRPERLIFCACACATRFRNPNR